MLGRVDIHCVLPMPSVAGIIHSVERPEDDHYKQLVADLASSYMGRPGVVIVATITCKEDIDTQVGQLLVTDIQAISATGWPASSVWRCQTSC